MTIQIALWAIVILLVILVVQMSDVLGNITHGAMGIQDRLGHIQSAAERWERSQRGALSFPEPESKPTKEEEQKRDESEQDRLRQQAEREWGGWQTARIVCRRDTSELLGCEYVLCATTRTYTVRGRWESFYSEGKHHIAQTLQLDTEVRFAHPKQGAMGLLLAENSEGRILSLRVIEEKMSDFGGDVEP